MRATALATLTGAAGLAAGLLLGLLLGGPGPGPSSPAPGEGRAGETAPASPEGAGSGGAPAPGGGEGAPAGGTASRGDGTAGAAGPAAGEARPGPGPGGAGPDEGGAPGSVRPGLRSGGPAETSATEEPGEEPEAAGEAGVDAAGADAAPGRPARSGALPPYVLPDRIAGRLFDAHTGRPIPGASVEFRWELSDGTVSSAVPVDLREDGTFSVEPKGPLLGEMRRMTAEGGWLRERFPTPEAALADLEFAIAGSARGYETLVKGDPGAEVRLPLVAEGVDLLPGWVRVDARRADGTRFPGRMLADFRSGDRGNFSQWAFPEPDGTFLLGGVPAGKWSVRASGKHDSGREILVPEAGEVRVEVAVPRAGLEESPDEPRGPARAVAVLLPGRTLPAGTFLRAEPRRGLFFRTEAALPATSFPALAAGRWTFALQSPGRADERFEAEVPAGEGVAEIAFPAPGAAGAGK